MWVTIVLEGCHLLLPFSPLSPRQMESLAIGKLSSQHLSPAPFITHLLNLFPPSHPPAACRQMESFAGGKLPSQPLYDLPSWLEHSYPQYDASPKSPWYSWVAWARDNLPREHQRLLHAFHDYMQDDKFRAGILRQANYVGHGGKGQGGERGCRWQSPMKGRCAHT